MENSKKRRRRRLLMLVVVVAVLFWVAGCAAGRSISMGLSAIVPSVEQGGEVLQGGEAGGDDGTGSEGGSVSGVGGEGGSQTESGETQTGSGGAGTDGNSGVIEGHTDGTGSNAEVDKTDGNSSGSGGITDGNDDGKKYVALTFDDGPDAKYTTAILDILKEKGVKATFFVVGQQVSKYPEVLQRIKDEGHSIGNHTQNHKDLKKLGKSGILEQISLTDQAIKAVLGETPSLFRAPYGSLSDELKRILKDEGRHHTGWTIDTRDWAGTSVADMRDMIIHDTKPNGIILMHSFGGKHIQNTVTMLPLVIDDLQKLGYTLVTVEELIAK
ncbi:polysaccharide deacetylase family protein [Paenibacillus sp. strain BS8-2]